MKRLCLLLMILCLAACSTGLKSNHINSFGETHEEFAKRLVWKDYGSAASFMDKEYLEDFQDKFRERGDIRVLEIRPEGVEFDDEDQTRAVSWSRIEYYRLPSNTLKDLKLRLEWEYRDNGWKIVSPFPDLP